MTLSRRSFLKMAALSTAAVAVSASMTGCATPFTPDVSIVLQEQKMNGKYAFTSDKANLKSDVPESKLWKDGKKVASAKNVGPFDLAKNLEDMSASDAKNLVKKILCETYKLAENQDIILKNGSSAIEVTPVDPAHYEFVIEFSVAVMVGKQ